MKLSLRWKILIIVFLLIIAPVALLGLNAYLTSKNLLTNNVRMSARDALESSDDVIDTFLKSVEEAVTMMSLDPTIQNLIYYPELDTRVLELFKAYVDAHADIENTFYGTRTKAFYVYPPHPEGLPPNFDPTSRPWYPRAVETKGIIWTEPYVDTGTDKLVVSVAAPVYRPEETQAVGVVGIDVSLDSLTNILSTRTVGQQGYLVLSDEQGRVLAHPDSSRVGNLIANEELRQAVLANRTTEMDYKEGREQRFAAFGTVARTGWKIAALISYDEANVHVRAQLVRTILIGLLLLGIAFAAAIIFANRIIINPVYSLAKSAVHIGTGNFKTDIAVTSNDELGVLADTFITLQKDLGKLIGEVKAASELTAQLSQSVFRSSQDISAATEEMAATTNQFSGSVQQMSDHVQSIDGDGTTIKKIAEDGQSIVLEAVNQMNSIETSFSGLHQNVAKLGEQSKEIGNITEIIRGISDQTNLLALNAAIEAARAGEQGRGFAVVAEEVRTLAEQTAEATEQIAELLRDINNQISLVINEADLSIEEVKTGSDKVRIAGETFAEIGTAISNISSRIKEVSTYALQLARGSEQMAAATEEQAATLQNITNSANDLAEQAAVLMELTEGFQI